MATVTMQVAVSGTRNGNKWPAAGETIDVPDSEAEGLVNLGLALFAGGVVKERPETRTSEPTKQAAKPPRKTKG